MSSTPEGKVKAKIRKFVEGLFPSAWGFMPVQTGYGKGGVPDHLYCIPVTVTPDMVGVTVGMFVSIEAKTSRGKVTQRQRAEAGKIQAAGGLYTVVYGIKDIEAALGGLRQLAVAEEIHSSNVDPFEVLQELIDGRYPNE